MAQAKSSSIPHEALALYDSVIGTVPGVERKGDTVPYTSLNGHMFSALDASGTLRIRLPKAELDPFLKKYKTEQPIAYGVVLKEYAIVPDVLLKKTNELKAYFKISHDFVASLKPAKSKASQTKQVKPKLAKSKKK